MLPTILKFSDIFLVNATTPSSILLSITVTELLVIPISVATACGL